MGYQRKHTRRSKRGRRFIAGGGRFWGIYKPTGTKIWVKKGATLKSKKPFFIIENGKRKYFKDINSVGKYLEIRKYKGRKIKWLKRRSPYGYLHYRLEKVTVVNQKTGKSYTRKKWVGYY